VWEYGVAGPRDEKYSPSRRDQQCFESCRLLLSGNAVSLCHRRCRRSALSPDERTRPGFCLNSTTSMFPKVHGCFESCAGLEDDGENPEAWRGFCDLAGG
jgi:hypothetical protein